MSKHIKKLDGVLIWCDEMVPEDFDNFCQLMEQTEIPFDVVVTTNPLEQAIELPSEFYFKALAYLTNFLVCTYETEDLEWMLG